MNKGDVIMNAKIGLWLYCVIENKEPLNLEVFGINGDSPVYTIADNDFAVAVSEEPLKKYPLARDFLINHQLVNEKIMEIQPVLPVKFCTMAEKKEQIIEQVLIQKEKTKEFYETFNGIRDKSEYGFRARWKNLDQVFSDISLNDEKVKRAKENVLKIPEKERHTALIDIGHVVKHALEEKNNNTAQLLINELLPFAVQSKKNNVFGDMNIVNAAFLVDKKNQEQFDKAVNELEKKYENIQFKYVGPTPPFNFVEIVIHWDEPQLPTHDKKVALAAGV
jgi:hypothetical protein